MCETVRFFILYSISRKWRIQNTGDRRREPESGGRRTEDRWQAVWAEGHPIESKGINHKFHEFTRRR